MVCHNSQPAPSVIRLRKRSNHVLSSCVLAREVWTWVVRRLNLRYGLLPRSDSRFNSWWRHACRSLPKELWMGFNSLVILVSWELWKHRKLGMLVSLRELTLMCSLFFAWWLLRDSCGVWKERRPSRLSSWGPPCYQPLGSDLCLVVAVRLFPLVSLVLFCLFYSWVLRVPNPSGVFIFFPLLI